jgi:hypothetical protein
MAQMLRAASAAIRLTCRRLYSLESEIEKDGRTLDIQIEHITDHYDRLNLMPQKRKERDGPVKDSQTAEDLGNSDEEESSLDLDSGEIKFL